MDQGQVCNHMLSHPNTHPYLFAAALSLLYIYLLFPMPSTVQLPLTGLEVLFIDQAVTFYIFSSFKPQAQKSSYSSSNFQIVSSNLRLHVVRSCCFFAPGLQMENSLCRFRDDFHWHFADEKTTVHFGVAFRKSCLLQEFVGDLPYGLSGPSQLRTKALLSLCSLPGDISSEC